MHRRWLRRATAGAAGGLGLLWIAGVAAATPTDLAQTMPLVWVMVGLSVGGAVVTFGIMAWALWRFRDRSTRERGYG